MNGCILVSILSMFHDIKCLKESDSATVNVENFIDSLDTLPGIIIILIDLRHVAAGHIDEGDEGKGDEDVAS